jgi:eukaryotic-like serine/threonine-protein kinase
MDSSSDARNPVVFLAEEFLDRKRRGEQPTLREYLERHPDLAADIEDLFPALLMMEDLGESSGGTTGSLTAENGAAVRVRLQRLGDYRILREIGRGGMGVVYEAEQESLGRRVALKVLSAGSLLDPKQVRRFEREAKAAARLHHTNIVPVFGVGRQDVHHYFVMQFIAGLGLDVVLDDLRRIRSGKSDTKPAANASRAAGLTGVDVARSLMTGRFDAAEPPSDGSVTEPFNGVDSAASLTGDNGPLADSGSSPAILPGSSELSASSDPDRQFYRSTARVGIQVAEALEYANRQGILHRDVKPSNLLLDNHGNVWVADFGLAKTAEADDLTHTGDILGTIRYMAPERFSGHFDARSDVYSLGLTLYELVSLRPAYEASDRHRLMERVLHEEPDRLKKLAPGVPRDLETIITKAIARDPAMRYATAAELAEDLRRYVEDRPIRARRVSSAERFARWCRRNKVLATSIGVAGAALLAVAVLALLFAENQRRLSAQQSLRLAEQTQATDKITRLVGDLDRRGKALESSLTESNRRLAMLNFERGQIAFEKGQIGPGMIWTIESLRLATEANDNAGRHLALANLSAWRRRYVIPKAVFSFGVEVRSVALSPDGKSIVTGGADKTARRWEVATGQPIGKPIVHSAPVSYVAFSPDGKTIWTGCIDDKTARRWDAATGEPIGAPLEHSGLGCGAAFSPDGKRIVTLTELFGKTARLWDAATSQPIGQPMTHVGAVFSVEFSPNGKTILTGGIGGARMWDAATGLPIGQPLANSDIVYGVAFGPESHTILTGGLDKTARLWDAATGQPVGTPMVHTGVISGVAFSPDGKTILTGSGDNMAQLWDAATCQRLGGPMEHQGGVHSVAFSADGKALLTWSHDGTARLWEAEVHEPIGRLLDEERFAWVAAFSADGKTVLTGGRDGKIKLWDTASGQLRGQPFNVGSAIIAIKISPDGRTIAASLREGPVHLLDSATGRPMVHQFRPTGSLMSISFSPGGKSLVTACPGDRTVGLWDAATGQPIGAPWVHTDPVASAAFSPDGKTMVIVTANGTARLWDSATRRPVGRPLTHSAKMTAAEFSPDGKTMVTASADETVRLWDVATGLQLGRPMVHPESVLSMEFSADGQTILTGSADSRARIWDVATCRPIGPALHHDYEKDSAWIRARFSPDGRSLVTSGFNSTALWDVPAPLPNDVPRLTTWVEAITGLALDERGSIRVLEHGAWLERRRRLENLGGSPPAAPSPGLDPIIFGADPAARADALAERGLGAQAEAAYAEAIRARPLSRSGWSALVRYYMSRGRPERAVEILDAAITRWPDSLDLRSWHCNALLAARDRIGWERAIAALLDQCQGPLSPADGEYVARVSVLGPYTVSAPAVPVRLAEAAVKGEANEFFKDLAISTLGAALYRAGRYGEAIRRLEEVSQLEGGAGKPQTWAFLAMAHERQHEREAAHHWLNRLRDRQPSSEPSQFMDELEIRLLRSEAEAVVLNDPIFPTEPFAN